MSQTKYNTNEWLRHTFSTGGYAGEDFKAFARWYRRHLKTKIGSGYEFAKFSVGHYEISGFIRNKDTGEVCYFSTSDVRFNKNCWNEHILIREAKHDRDFTGGMNQYCTLNELPKLCELLTD